MVAMHIMHVFVFEAISRIALKNQLFFPLVKHFSFATLTSEKVKLEEIFHPNTDLHLDNFLCGDIIQRFFF